MRKIETQEEIDKFFEDEFVPWYKQHGRSAWIPMVEDGDSAVTASKYSGLPYLPDGEWPNCRSCDVPLQFLLQVNLTELPKPAQERLGTGILQCFYHCDADEDCFGMSYGQSFGGNHLTRIIPLAGDVAEVTPPGDQFPAKRIVGWREIIDYPSYKDLERLGWVHLDEELLMCGDLEVEIHCSFEDWYMEEETVAKNDKIGGWPYLMHFNNSDTINPCLECSGPTPFFFGQIRGRVHVPYDFGDGGMLLLHACETHRARIGAYSVSG